MQMTIHRTINGVDTEIVLTELELGKAHGEYEEQCRREEIGHEVDRQGLQPFNEDEMLSALIQLDVNMTGDRLYNDTLSVVVSDVAKKRDDKPFDHICVNLSIRRFYKVYLHDETFEMTDGQAIAKAKEIAMKAIESGDMSELCEDSEIEAEEDDIIVSDVYSF